MRQDSEPSSSAPEDVRLPDNAFTELAPGETYRPVVPVTAGLLATSLSCNPSPRSRA